MKSNQIILKISLILVLLLSYTAKSQEVITASELSQEWHLLKEKDGVKIYTRAEQCKVGPLEKPLSYVLIKIVNETSNNHDVYFQIGIHYDQECIGCDDREESKKAIKVSANSSVECDCTFTNGELSLLITNPNYPDARVFQSLELIDLKVN